MRYISGYRNYSHSAIHPVERKRKYNGLMVSCFVATQHSKNMHIISFDYINFLAHCCNHYTLDLLLEVLGAYCRMKSSQI